jgi:hypothetical protein
MSDAHGGSLFHVSALIGDSDPVNVCNPRLQPISQCRSAHSRADSQVRARRDCLSRGDSSFPCGTGLSWGWSTFRLRVGGPATLPKQATEHAVDPLAFSSLSLRMVFGMSIPPSVSGIFDPTWDTAVTTRQQTRGVWWSKIKAPNESLDPSGKAQYPVMYILWIPTQTQNP